MIDLAAILPQLVLAFSGALFGALLGGAVSWTRARRERRLKLTLDLYAEFGAPEFNRIRLIAHDALTGAPDLPTAYAQASGEAREAIYSIVHFWEKAALLTRADAVDGSLMARFFGQYARWWRDLLCRAPAEDDPEWGQTVQDMDWLFRRLTRKDQRKGSRR
ncbi:MAG: hypothetical protein NW200_06450 [Hyphomonadaceae bacterium]|nr:hypothetical protein [Hyphomonadaceae bacterium]